jgi:hypothetical protein
MPLPRTSVNKDKKGRGVAAPARIVSLVVVLAPPNDLAVSQNGVLGGVVGQHRVAPGAAVDVVVLGFPTLPRVYQVPAAAAKEPVGVAPANQIVGAA